MSTIATPRPDRPTPRAPGGHPGAVAACVGLAVLLHLVLTQHTALAHPGSFRNAWAGDQLGYLAIATNVAEGQSAGIEPFTETGTNTYPSLWYVLLGIVARTGIGVVAAWNLVGMAVQGLAVAVVGWLLARLTARPGAALLVPLVLLAGPTAWAWGSTWYLQLSTQAVAWGPYGVLSPLNSEAAMLAATMAALGGLGHVWLLPSRPATRWATSAAAALVVGAGASIHTYTFLMTAYGVAAILAITTILARRAWRTAALSAVLLLGVFVGGVVVGPHLGTLPALLLGLAPFLPGLVLLLSAAPVPVAALGALCVAAAAPQLLATVAAARSGDPFMAYRVASNVSLGVVAWRTVAASLPLVILLVGAAVVALRRGEHRLAGTAAGLALIHPYLSLNDVWGANAEPYRFWIETFLVGWVGLAVVLAGLLAPRRGHPRAAGARILAIAAVVALAASLPDFVAWRQDTTQSATWSPSSPRPAAMAALADDIDGPGLVLLDACSSSVHAKVSLPGPMAHYRLGMAWPADKAAIDAVERHRDRRTAVSLAELEAADVGWVLSDSACGRQWLSSVAGNLDVVAEEPYKVGEPGPDFPNPDGVTGEQRLTLLKVRRG